MGLLYPGMLLLGLGVAVPLILHLFQRHQGPRVVFPALRYLRRAEHESARKVRLRQILLMLLRVAGVLLIALAAARPFSRAAGVEHEPTAVVIILDNSASSGAVSNERRMIDVLKERALETAAAAQPEDRLWLMRAGAADEPALPGDAVETARRIRETEPTDAAADITAATARAAAILNSAAGGRAREIQILSDLQSSNLSSQVTSAVSKDIDVVAWTPDRDAFANRFIRDVVVGGGIAPGANERTAVSVAIDGSSRDTANVRLVINGRLAAAGRAPVGGVALLHIPARPAGILTGWVEIDADALRADNRRYFAARIAEPPTVSVTRAAPFLDEALATMNAAGRIHRSNSGRSDITILPGGGDQVRIDAGTTAVIVPPESPLELDALNRRLAASGIPWHFALQPNPGEARFAHVDSTDALLRTLENARLRNVYQLQPGNAAAGDSVLLRLRDGAAWAVRGTTQAGGRYVLIASPLTESATSIPTSVAMLPLLDRILRVWSAGTSGTEDAMPGSLAALPEGADTIVRPDSAQEPVTSLQYRVPSRAGIYEVMSKQKLIAAFAVNTALAESDTARASRADVQRFAHEQVAFADSRDAWTRRIFHHRVGIELWRPLLIALLAVLVIESMVAAAGSAVRSVQPRRHAQGTA